MSPARFAFPCRVAENVFLGARQPLRSLPQASTASSPHSTFTALFQEHFTWVLSAVQRFGVHPRNTEDVAQDVFVAVFNALPPQAPGQGACPLRVTSPWGAVLLLPQSSPEWKKLLKEAMTHAAKAGKGRGR
jgi:hypothetical protein